MTKKRTLALILVLLLLVALFQLDRESLINSIKQIPLWLALLLFVLQIITQLLINLQWYQIAKLCDAQLSFWNMLYANSKGAIVDSITPGVKIGGEVARTLTLSTFLRKTIPEPNKKAAIIVAIQKLFSLSALFSIMLFAVGYLIGEISFFKGNNLQFAVYGLLLAFLLLFTSIFIIPYQIKAYLQTKTFSKFSWLCKLRDFLLILIDCILNIRKNKKVWMALALLSSFIWFLFPAKMYILTMYIYSDINWVYVGAITFVAYMIAMLPIFPGGLGGFEGTMLGLLVAVGLTTSDATVITIFFRFVTFWFVMFVSLDYVIIYKKFAKNFYNPIDTHMS